MQPIIKWPGGKSKEFELVKDLIPSYTRYIEPFFGGGAVFFCLKPNNSIINDICEELIEFYRFVKGENNQSEFKKCLYDYVDNWEKVPKFLNVFEHDLAILYNEYKLDKKSEQEIKEIIRFKLWENENHFNGLFSREFALDPHNLLEEIIKNLISKIRRTKQVEKERGALPEGDLYKNFETAFRSGFYMHFRDVMNKNGQKYITTKAKKIANYYFIREFCYGSMFRFNSDGYFNIPYGGIAYNHKDFRGKVDYIFSKEVVALFKNSIIMNTDFEKVFTAQNLTENDFMFLDPPYDTDFSNYEKKDFGKNDHIRLANSLYITKAKFILIIKETPFITGLYAKRRGIRIDSFEKKYLYNVKGRNNREAQHLVVYNFEYAKR